MNPEMVKKALEAIKAGDGDAAAAILEEMIAAAAAGAAAADMPADGEALSETPDENLSEPQKEEKAALGKLRSLTGKTNLGEACEAIAGGFARLAKIDGEQATLDAGARLSLIADLVKLGAETPATAWDGDPKDRKPVARLASEPLADMRARVKALGAGRPPPAKIDPPAGPAGGDAGSKQFSTPHGVVTLSAREIANCAELGAKVETYAANKAVHEAARRGGKR